MRRWLYLERMIVGTHQGHSRTYASASLLYTTIIFLLPPGFLTSQSVTSQIFKFGMLIGSFFFIMIFYVYLKFSKHVYNIFPGAHKNYNVYWKNVDHVLKHVNLCIWNFESNSSSPTVLFLHAVAATPASKIVTTRIMIGCVLVRITIISMFFHLALAPMDKTMLVQCKRENLAQWPFWNLNINVILEITMWNITTSLWLVGISLRIH